VGREERSLVGVNGFHREGGVGVAEVAGEKHHQRGKSIVVETVPSGQIKVGVEAVA
jgi:hypothetical protein